MFEKLLANFGYIKGQKIRELIEAESQGTDALMSLWDTKPENYDQFLKAYADEVWVYACVYTIANAIAGLPTKIYRDIIKNGEKQQDEIIEGSVINLIQMPYKDDPNLTWYNLMEFTMASLELTGNSYWLHEQIVGRPSELLPLITSRVSIKPGKEKFIDKYIYKIPGIGEKPYNPEEISHFKYMNPSDNIYGLGSLSPGKYPVVTYKEMIKTNLNIFKNGAKVDGFLKTDKKLDDSVFNHLLYQFNLRHKGAGKAHKIGLLEQGLDFKEVSQSLKELEFNLGMKLTREEICAVFGVPPLLVGILDKATYANYKESVKIFYKLSIIPKLHRIKPVIDNTVIKKFDKRYYIVFDLTNVEALKEDEKAKSEIAKNYFSLGIPVEQINKKLDLGFKEYEGWDVGYLPIALVSTGTPPKEKPPKGEPPKSKGFEMTDEWKMKKWEGFVKIAGKVEKAYTKIIDKHFSEQEKQLLSKLGGKKELEGILSDLSKQEIELMSTLNLNDEVKSGVHKYLYEKIEKANIVVESILFNEKNEVVKWASTSKKVHTVALEESAKRELETIGVDIVFDINNPRVVKFLEKYSLRNSKEVIGTVRRDVKDTLLAGVREGEGIPQLRKRITDVYEPFKDAKYKATRIARTEVIGASNQGALEAYQQSGVVEKKAWYAEPDARESHLIAARDYNEKNAIGIDEDFNVGAGSGQAPGQIGVAEEDINCRCTLLPVVKK